MLRMRAVDMVEDAGYVPVEAVDADEAFAILQARSDIALLFTDIQMPGSMDCRSRALAAAQDHPGVGAIGVVGHPDPAR
jgi:CheY-like chemotaxis protein